MTFAVLSHFIKFITSLLKENPNFFFYSATSESVPVIMVDVSALTDDELRKQLTDYGVNVGPVVCKYI